MFKAEPSIVNLADWFRSETGLYALEWEKARFDALVADVFGYHALQVGMPELDFLENNRIAFKMHSFPSNYANSSDKRLNISVLAESELLPVASQSIDLLLLPHGLEVSMNPHQVLREAERVLVPEGRVVISGFNPWSLWGLRHRSPFCNPWLPVQATGLVSLPRLKDWLKLLSFDLDRGHGLPLDRTEGDASQQMVLQEERDEEDGDEEQGFDRRQQRPVGAAAAR